MHLAFAISAISLAIIPMSVGAQDSAPSICFPATIDDLQQVVFPKERLDAMRKYRNTEVAGYNSQQFNTAVTVYIYDKEPVKKLAQEFSSSASEILQTHAGAESPMSGPSKLNIGGKPTAGLLGVFLWSEGETDYGSFLWTGELAGQYVKVRTTYIRPEDDGQTGGAMQYAMAAMRNVAGHVCRAQEPKV